MKKLKTLTAAALAISFLATPLAAMAADAKTNANTEAKSEAKPKPYPLTTCVVSGDKLGEMGKPYVFTYEGREIKLCCAGCKKAFDKDPAKYIKKLEAAEAKVKK
jgi:YHS domain-containing protein